ncbi:hypothetical protein THRCLA_22425, partial [Thraustotheca clavata]
CKITLKNVIKDHRFKIQQYKNKHSGWHDLVFDMSYLNMTKRSLGAVHDIVFSEEEHAILDVLMSSPGEDSNSEKPSAYKRQVMRQKEELSYLKSKVHEMQIQLDALTLNKEIDEAITPPSHWKELAKNERRRQFEAQQENRKLKEALEEQMQFAQSLINLIRKKPRLCMFPTDPNHQWKELKLVADPVPRFTAFHAIADREYENLLSAFIMAGLVDTTDSPQKHVPRMCNNTLEIHTTFAVRVPRFSTADLDFKILSESVYDVMRGSVDITRRAKRELIAEIDDNVSYTGMSRVYPKGKWLRRIVCKRYYESNPKRCVIVTRSIIEDELLPIDPSFSISGELSWFTVDCVPNGDFILKYVHKIQPFTTTDTVTTTLVSEYVMELNVAFTNAFEFCALESQRRFKEYKLDFTLFQDEDGSVENLTPYQRQVLRQKEELKYLKLKIKELETQIDTLTLHKVITDAVEPPSQWKELAENEQRQNFEAQQENRKLKAAVEEQVQFARALVKLIRKKPRLCVFPTDPNDQWKELKLVADPVVRFAAFHAIADKELENWKSAFIAAGLIDCSDVPQKHEPRMCNNTLEVHTTFAVRLPVFSTDEVIFKLLTDCIFDILRGAVKITRQNGKRELLAEIDENVSYLNMSRDYLKGKWLRRVVCKRHMESNLKRCVIVTRSIKEDDLLPIDPSYSSSSEVSWFTIDYVDNCNFILKFYHKVQPFSAADTLTSILISEFVMELNVSFSNTLKFCAMETKRRFEEHKNYVTKMPLKSVLPSTEMTLLCSTQDLSKLPASTRHVRRQQEELAYLKLKVQELNGILDTLMFNKEIEDAVLPPGKWKQLAQSERKRQHESLAENERLRAAIQEQVQFAESLATLIRKKPRLCVFPTDPNDQWKELRLVAEPTARYAGFHAIVDREYGYLSSAFVEAGLIDALSMPPLHVPYMHNDTLIIQSKFALQPPLRVDLDVELKVLTDTIWDVLRGAVDVPSRTGTREILTQVDDSVSYTMNRRPYRLGTSQRRVIYKRYFEQNPLRFVVVGRSIEDDEVHPIHQGCDVAKEVMWTTVELIDHTLLLKYFHKTQPFPANDKFTPPLISEYLMDIHATFAGAVDAITLEAQRRIVQHINAKSELVCVSWNGMRQSNPHQLAPSCFALQPEHHFAVEMSGKRQKSPDTEPFSAERVLSAISPHASERSAYQRFMDRQHAEMDALRERVKELRGQLTTLKSEKELRDMTNPPSSEWEAMANYERKRLTESMIENRRLKASIKEHRDFAHALDVLLSKKPRAYPFPTVPADQWKAKKLVADPIMRYSAYHEIMNNEYKRLRSAFMEVGLIDCEPLVPQHEPKIFGGSTLQIYTKQATYLPRRFSSDIDFNLISGTMWDCVRAVLRTKTNTGFREFVVQVDESLAYTTTRRSYTLGTSERHTIYKRYYEENPKRFVLIWCSIEDDELYPFHQGYDSGREIGWSVLEPQGDDLVMRIHHKIQPFIASRDLTPAMINRYHMDIQMSLAVEFDAFLREVERRYLAYRDRSFETHLQTRCSAYRRHVTKQQQELTFLRNTIHTKQEELQALQAKREREEATVATTRWQQLAKGERKRHYDAMMENRRLRTAINEQLEFAEALAELIRKKPRLCVFPTDPKDQWKELKLVSEPTARYAAFHSIVDREYAKMESAFIQAKILDATNVPPCHEPHLHNETLEVHTKLVFQFPPSPNLVRDFAILTESIWDILRGGVAVTKLEGFRELLVEVDNNVAYTTTTRQHSLGALQRRVIYKRYNESIPNVRFCIVGRSVEEDELQPLSSDLDICKETTWCSVETLENGLVFNQTSKNSYCFGMAQWPLPSIMALPTPDNIVFEEYNMLDDIFLPPTVSSSSSENEAPKKQPSKQVLAVQRHRLKQRNELNYLKSKVGELQMNLNNLTQAKALQDILHPPSKWEKLAKNERRRQQEALLENTRLKEALEEQVQFAECLVNIVQKKPRLALNNSEANDQWKLLKLVADPAAREAAYHAIVDREYAKLNSAFVEAGLIETTWEGRKHIPVLHHGILEVQTLIRWKFPVLANIVADAVWEVARGALQVMQQAYTMMVEVEPSLTYITGKRESFVGNIQRRVIAKRYYEADPPRWIMITRSIYDDELYPLLPDYSIANEVAWMVIEMDNQGMTEFKYFQKAKPSVMVTKQQDDDGKLACQYLMEIYAQSLLKVEQEIHFQMEKLGGGINIKQFAAKMVDEAWHDVELFDGSTLTSDFDLSAIDGSAFAAENKALNAPRDPRDKARQALQRHRQRQRDELAFLKRKVVDLQQELERLMRETKLREILRPPGKWEKLAKDGRLQCTQAMVENRELKEAIDEQVEFAQSLTSLVRKQPNLRNDVCEHWKQYKLVADPDTRKIAYHAIIQRDYANLMGAFIEAELIEPKKEGRQCTPLIRDGHVEIQTVLYKRVEAPLDDLMGVTWDIFHGLYAVTSHKGVYRVLEEVDQDTLYVGSLRHYSLGKIQRRIIFKRFQDGPNRWIIVSRNIHEDEVFCLDSHLGQAHEVSWMTFEWNSDAACTDVKYYQKAIPYFVESPIINGKVKGVPVSQHVMEIFSQQSVGYEQAMRSLLQTKSNSNTPTPESPISSKSPPSPATSTSSSG